MKKKLVGALLAFVLVLGVFAFSACDMDARRQRELEVHRAEAKNTLATYAEDKGQINYTGANWRLIREIVADGKEAINAASDKARVDYALAAATDAIGEVPKNTGTPREVETFAVEDFDEAFFDNNTLVFVPFYHGQVVGGVFFHAVYVENDKVNFIFEVNYLTGDQAVTAGGIFLILSNEIFEKYTINPVIKQFHIWNRDVPLYECPNGCNCSEANFECFVGLYKFKYRCNRGWLEDIYYNSVSHRTGFIFDQYSELFMFLPPVIIDAASNPKSNFVAMSSMESFNDMLKTATWLPRIPLPRDSLGSTVL